MSLVLEFFCSIVTANFKIFYHLMAHVRKGVIWDGFVTTNKEVRVWEETLMTNLYLTNGIKKLSHSKVYKIKIQCAKANQT